MNALILISAVSLAQVLCTSMTLAATSTEEAIVESFTVKGTKPSIERKDSAVTLQVCSDTCDLYRARRLRNETDLWDLVFLHQYYFNQSLQSDEFRVKYSSLAADVVRSHAHGCAATEEMKKAACAVAQLQKHLRARYAFVRYDEGYRCEVQGRILDSTYEGATSCTRLMK